jgi:hypothetical protein
MRYLFKESLVVSRIIDNSEEQEVGVRESIERREKKEEVFAEVKP